MELVHRDDLLGDLVEFLDRPADVVELREVVGGDMAGVGERGGENPLVVLFGALADEAQGDWLEVPVRPARGELAARVLPRGDGQPRLAPVAVHERLEGALVAPLEAEHGVGAGVQHGVEELVGEVAAVEHDDVAPGQVPEVAHRGGPLAGVGGQGEVDGHLRVEPVEAGDEPLGVVAVAERLEPLVGQRARGQVVHPHPREDQEPRVAQRQMQPPPVPVEDEPPQARHQQCGDGA